MDDIVTLKGCKRLRESKSITAKGITDTHLAGLTGISHDRVKRLESLDTHKAQEPWLDEAQLIAGALCCDLQALIGSTMLADLDTGFDIQSDLDVWATGVRLPLRYGIRLGRLFDIDPFDLVRVAPIYRQIWSVVETGERLGAATACVWCRADIVGGYGHDPACLPTLLFGPRQADISIIGVAPKPRKPGVRRSGSKHAPGLAKLRAREGVTQAEFASGIGKHPAYYYRLESLLDPLTGELAEKIAALYKISLHEVYYG